MTSDFRIQLGQRIRQTRTERGFRNGKDFARALGIDASQLSRLERGLRRIDTVLLRRIATVLNVPVEDLLPNERAVGGFARRGESDDGDMQAMIEWALVLREDLDGVADYVGTGH